MRSQQSEIDLTDKMHRDSVVDSNDKRTRRCRGEGQRGGGSGGSRIPKVGVIATLKRLLTSECRMRPRQQLQND